MSARLLAIAAIASGVCFAGEAGAVPIFSQTPVAVQATGSDSDVPQRVADEFILAAPATVRSVTWQGVFTGNTPVFPVSFTLSLFADSANLPGAALANTTVNVTGVDTGTDVLGLDIYEFQADLPATALLAGVQYWFSPLASTELDADDNWFWSRSGDGSLRAFQPDVAGNGPWISSQAGQHYFILDDAALAFVPEPATATLGLLGLAGLMMRRRRLA